MENSPGRTRTTDILLRSETFYPTELRGHMASLYHMSAGLCAPAKLAPVAASGPRAAMPPSTERLRFRRIHRLNEESRMGMP